MWAETEFCIDCGALGIKKHLCKHKQRKYSLCRKHFMICMRAGTLNETLYSVKRIRDADRPTRSVEILEAHVARVR